ncbi:MAG: phosphatidylserine/phosphatidylglycerophosphate/cardiolipin synthase family protein [Proteobacteria bacterium]|nr:phosphatidylserine/phosphatidylglycerophosphate/cardiolipin synthase family protein [Pseudomonadota bacterium]
MNSETLLSKSQEYQSVLLGLIEESKKEILISCYIIVQDQFGKKIMDALAEKAKQGVHVRLIADGLAAREWVDKHADSYRCEHFDVRVYHPMSWHFLGVSIKNIFWGLNRRNHHKLFIFDRKIALIGSRNIHNEALEWRETNIKIEGPSIEALCSLFAITWQKSDAKWRCRYNLKNIFRENKVIKASDQILSTHKASLRRKNQKLLVSKILNASKNIQITTPYFFPTRKILKRILIKARSGVQVFILLPNATDVLLSKWIAQYHYEKLLKAGVVIYEYQPAVLHSKTTKIDDWALIGTSNMNRRSVQRDLEIDYIISLPETIEHLEKIFDEDVVNSKQVVSGTHLNIGQKLVVLIAIKLFPSWF